MTKQNKNREGATKNGGMEEEITCVSKLAVTVNPVPKLLPGLKLPCPDSEKLGGREETFVDNYRTKCATPKRKFLDDDEDEGTRSSSSQSTNHVNFYFNTEEGSFTPKRTKRKS